MSKNSKMVRRIFNIFPFLIGSFSSAFLLSGCGANNPIIINSEEEFYKMEEKKYYKLGCDLDLYGKSWTPLKVKGFDGDGHTISGLMIGSTDYWYYGSGKVASIFLSADHVKNVTINRCTLVASEVETLSIVGISVKSYENVNVQKCVITGTMSLSPEYFVLSASFLNSNRGPNYCSSISNCSVSDCELSFTNSTYVYCMISGLNDGSSEGTKSLSLKNCSIENCEFEVKSEKSDVFYGGICGVLPFALNDDSIKISELKADNCRVELTGDTIESGGIFGSCYRYVSDFKEYEGKNIVSSNNDFTIKANTDLMYGGIAGRFDGVLNNSLSKNNNASLSNKNKGVVYLGGVLGNGALTTKYTVCDNSVFSTYNLKLDSNKSSFVGGLVGKQNGSLLNSFISFNNGAAGFDKTSQVCKEASLVKNIYIYNGIESSEYIALDNKADFINRLSLGLEWSINNDDINLNF